MRSYSGRRLRMNTGWFREERESFALPQPSLTSLPFRLWIEIWFCFLLGGAGSGEGDLLYLFKNRRGRHRTPNGGGKKKKPPSLQKKCAFGSLQAKLAFRAQKRRQPPAPGPGRLGRGWSGVRWGGVVRAGRRTAQTPQLGWGMVRGWGGGSGRTIRGARGRARPGRVGRGQPSSARARWQPASQPGAREARTGGTQIALTSCTHLERMPNAI